MPLFPFQGKLEGGGSAMRMVLVILLAAAQDAPPVLHKIADTPTSYVFVSAGAKRLLTQSASGSTPDGATATGSIKLWDLSKKANRYLDQGDLGDIDCTPDFTLAARLLHKGPTDPISYTIELFDPSTGEQKGALRYQDKFYGHRLSLSPDGKFLAAGQFTGWVNNAKADRGAWRVFDVAAGRQIQHVPDLERIDRVAVSPDGKVLVTDHPNPSQARVWDVASGKTVKLLDGHSAPIMDIGFSPDGRWFATASNDGTAVLWDPQKSWAKAATLKRGKGSLYALAFSPDSTKLAASGKDLTVTIWDVTTRKALKTLAHPKPKPKKPSEYEGVLCISFDPEGKFLAAGGWDGVVSIWSLTGTLTETGR
jgi:WD40 repeat protein